MESGNGGEPPAIPGVAPRELVAWREGTRTRAAELKALNAWMRKSHAPTSPNEAASVNDLHDAIDRHLVAAVDATRNKEHRWSRNRTGARLEAAISNLDAAEALLFLVGPTPYVLGQMPSVLNAVKRYLTPADPRRKEIESIAKELGVNEPTQTPKDTPDPRYAIIDRERGKIISAVRGTASAALREQTRLRSFRNVVVATTIAMAVMAATLCIIGWRDPQAIPLCFAPEAAGQTTIVCPTEQEGPVPTPGAAAVTAGTDAPAAADEEAADIDELINKTVSEGDVALVELIGVTAAAIAAAGAIRRVRGSSEPYGVPIALALLKLPTGAVTAFLGLLLMRGGFIPGLSALDTSAQILAWAIIFGYAQQLFTGLVDQQAHSVLDSVRGGNKATE